MATQASKKPSRLNARNPPAAPNAAPVATAPVVAQDPPIARSTYRPPAPKASDAARKAQILHTRRFAHTSPVPGEAHVPFDPYELLFEAPPPPRLATINVRLEDKAVFDAMQGLINFHKGRRVSQWELFTIVLADAIASPEGAAAQTGFSG
jgi:hypothetical protein